MLAFSLHCMPSTLHGNCHRKATAAADRRVNTVTLLMMTAAAFAAAVHRCTVTGRELTVQLGKRAVLQPQQDSLTLLPWQTVLFDVLDPSARFSGNSLVAMCSNCQPPEAAITGPSVGGAVRQKQQQQQHS